MFHVVMWNIAGLNIKYKVSRTLTDTWGARNKGSGRKARGLPLHY